MNNNINNEKVSVPTGISLNDKDYLTNLLTLLKDIEKNMTVALTEASNEHLYKEYKYIFDKFSSLQRKCYELMFQNGWYMLEKVPQAKVNTLVKNLETQLKDLN